MRTVLLKTLSLIVLAQGMLLVALAADPLTDARAHMAQAINYFQNMAQPGWAVYSLVGALLILLAVVGLFPQGRRGRRISFRSEHGEVTMELGPVQKTLTRLINTLPEVRRIRVAVMPDAEGRRVEVLADVVLQNCAEQGVRRTSNLVSDCIAEAVTRSLGLEGLVNVQLNVSGIHVDAKAAARRLRDEMDNRVDPAGQRLTAALARPPISAVTMEAPAVEEPVKTIALPAEKVTLTLEKSSAQLDEETVRLEAERNRLADIAANKEDPNA